ncbi:uncharacterized protein [Fopius arisanus]|uniref:G2/M phase-specific E3 ubiquitin-protein ligase n=2 Tax=Fopius arisanus TaxID=64838 RepID=A0A9R1TUZ3_9HYME|nr:PREDICTED: uncharacterized protein LOC105262882 [Fopius arisanus]
MPRRDRHKIDRPVGSEKTCVFCNSSEDNELKYGKIHEYNGIITHYYCLLLSSNMQQKGDDDEGILGFLTLDILNELKRGKRLACSYCKKIGATLGCCNTKCKKIFHLPCGLKAGSLHQFFGEFRSYCVSHRPKQKIDERIRAQISDQLLCYICYDNVDRNNLFETLWAPCCKKNAWFHRLCVQQLAMSAGYFFKCPLCNNKKEFQKAMLDNGIFIPCQDASWELVPNAFQELLYRHNRCDASQCICSKGRTYTSSNPKWELILCRSCGSQGVHVACGRLKWGDATWDCRECCVILNKTEANSEETRMSSNSTPSVAESTKNDSCQSDSEGSDSDISVGVEEPVYGPTPWPTNSHTPPQAAIRPGPKSFKLKQQKMMREMSESHSEGTSSEASSWARGGVQRLQNPSSSSRHCQPNARIIPGSSTCPEELVILDSDEEFLPDKSPPPISHITENMLMKNNEVTISSKPVTLTSSSTNQSIGYIAFGPSDDPTIIGNIQMPSATSPSALSPNPTFANYPEAFTQNQPPKSPLMAIQITNVTSVPLEEFGKVEPQDVPVSSTLNTTPEIVDVESDNEDISYTLSMAQQLTRASTEMEQGNVEQQTNREKRPAQTLPEDQNAVDENSTSQVPTVDLKRPRTDHPSERVQNTPQSSNLPDRPYIHGVALDRAAIVNVLGKKFVLPLTDESRVTVNNTWVPNYDGDAGTKPAGETEPITRYPSDRADSMEIRSGATVCDGYEPASTDPGTNLDTPIHTGANTPASHYSDRLSNNSVSLKDLKFRVCGSRSLKMTVNDIITMNLELDTGQYRRPGPKCAVWRRRNGSSLVRRSSLAVHESRNQSEPNSIESPTRESSSKFTKSPERRKTNSLKENLAPEMSDNGYLSPSPERKIKRLRLDSEGASIHFESGYTKGSSILVNGDHPGTSRDGLKELSHSLINQRRECLRHSSKVRSTEVSQSCHIPKDKEGLPVSIELSRIQPLLLSKPALFEGNVTLLPRQLVKFHSISDLRGSSSSGNHYKGFLRRTKSLNNLLSLSSPEIFYTNVNDNQTNPQRRGQKRKKLDCMR